MKLKLQDMFKSASGKVCQDSDFYTTTRNGKTYTGRICHPNHNPPTAEQQAQRQKFKEAVAEARRIVANKNSEEYKTYEAAWKAQSKYATVYGYIFAVVFGE